MRYADSGRPQARGFTLVELLVVVAIIALLLAMLLPSMREARDLAKIVSCSSNQRQLLIAAASYASEFNQAYPYQGAGGSEWVVDRPLTANAHLPTWVGAIWPYIGKSLDVMACDSIRDAPGGAGPTETERFGYVMNGVVAHFGLRGVRYPATTAGFSDNYEAEALSVLRPHFVGGPPSLTAARWSGWMRFASGSEIRGEPHAGKVLGFVDGHAAYLQRVEITSRDFGLLIEGQDTEEANIPSYGAAGRAGKVEQ